MGTGVRRARLDDAPAIAELFEAYRQFYRESPAPQAASAFISERLEEGDSVILIAEDERGAAGFTQLYPLFSSTKMRRLWVLNDLFVYPRARNAGTGRALMKAAETFARSTSASGLILETAVDNTIAQALYESEGYVRDVAFYRYERGLD
jgi:GNAT superfamily N-acetyltransferase